MRSLLHRLAMFLLGLSLLGVYACSSCDETAGGVGPGLDPKCGHTPDIVRVEFDPKEGRAPLSVAFTVVGEDEDLDVCEDEALLYHWDFDSNGFEDMKPSKTGRVKHVFREAGDFKIAMWVTDKDQQASKKVVKYIKVGANKAPVITSFFLDTNTGESPFDANLHWAADDADGTDDLVKYTLDWGDGTKASDTQFVASNNIVHRYTGVGTFKITLRVYDSIGASAQKALDVAASTRVLPTNFMQTIGSSKALWLDDNDGAHYAADFGLYDWMLVADGPIGLKVLRYPLDAFAVGGGAPRPAEMVGMSDPGGQFGDSLDVVAYGNIAAAAGYGGMFVWNYRQEANAPACQNPWDTGCYPGSPTHPAAYCSLSDSARFFPSQDLSRAAILKPSGTGQVWAVAANLPGTGEWGGISGVRLDEAVNPSQVRHLPVADTSAYAYDSVTGKLTMNLAVVTWQTLQTGRYRVYDPATGASALIKQIGASGTSSNPTYWAVLAPGLAGFPGGAASVYAATSKYDDCWTNAGLKTYQQTNAFGGTVLDMKVDGDYAYVGFGNTSQGGFAVFDIGPMFVNSGAINNYVWNLGNTMPWSVMTQAAPALALTYPRPVTGDLAPAAFLSYASLLADPYRGNCDEAQRVSAAVDNGATVSITAAPLLASDYLPPFGYYPDNRVAIRFGDGSVDTNRGAGYRVVSFAGALTVLAGPAASAPATWVTATVYPYGVTEYAILPSYPGRNAVTLSGAGASGLVRNGRCLNVLNAYAPVTAPVHVSFTTAPLVFAYILSAVGGGYQGLYAFDRTDPQNLVQLAATGPFDWGTVPSNMTWHDDKLYMASGLVGILDVSDPYHLNEAFAAHSPPDFADDRYVVVGTHSRAAGAPPFELNEIMFLAPPTNPQGAILTADGPLGVGALYVDELMHSTYTARDTGAIAHNCLNDYWESACLSYLPDLQMRHEGRINDIALVENRYALVAQNMGGVLVFDISGVAYAGDPTFVSHIRTVGNPLSLKYVTDATHKTLFIADTTSLVKIDDFDPARLPRALGSLVGAQSQGYTCVDAATGRTFACAGSAIYYAPGVTVPVTEILVSVSSDNHTCTYDAAQRLTQNGVSHLWTDWLGNRLFLFGDGPGTSIREIVTDGFGHIDLASGSARACQWNFMLGGQAGIGASKLGFYQNRPGLWKRFYTSSGADEVVIWDIDALEDAIAAPGYDMRAEPNLISRLDLSPYNGRQSVPIVHLSALGPYLFIGAGDTGAWVVDMSNGVTPRLIGRSAIKVPGLQVGAMNSIVYANDPQNTASGYTYLLLVSDNSDRGGILLLRYPQLAAP